MQEQIRDCEQFCQQRKENSQKDEKIAPNMDHLWMKIITAWDQKDYLNWPRKRLLGMSEKPPSLIMGRERDRDISAYFKNKERFFLTSISSKSFLVLMNSSADCSSLDRRTSSLLKAKESQNWEKV